MKNCFCIIACILFQVCFAMALPKLPVPGFESILSKQEVRSFAPSASDNTLLVVNKNQLGQDLVWTLWLERVDNTLYKNLQSGLSSESMVVHFQLSADQKFVHLLEKNANPADPRNPALVDRFPVTSLSPNSVTFDYSQGLNHRFLKAFFQPEILNEIKFSYSSVYNFVNSDDVVTFSQMMKLSDANDSTLIVHHAFRSFSMSPGFEPVKVLRPDLVGIMPAKFTVETNDAEPITIRHWNLSRPIKFYISSNTPKEYIPAIKEGFQWWNKALGKQFIEIEVLNSPVEWGDARRNIFQWSDDPKICAGASAIGPSEANPVTGEIYSGKIIFCGPTLMQTFDFGIEPGTVSKEAYFGKLLAWGTAHEMGHVLGFEHNFKGKSYKDQQYLNSTVMDYPYPTEIMNYNGVGPADLAKVQVAYLQPGNAQAFSELKKFPLCTDDETGVMADCNRFVHGHQTPTELSQRYLGLLAGGKPFPALEHKARVVVLKQWFTEGAATARVQAATLLKIYPGSRKVLLEDMQQLFKSSHKAFLKLSPSDQKSLLDVMAQSIFESPWSTSQRKALIDLISDAQTYAAYETLQSLSRTVDDRLVKDKEPTEQENLFRLREKLRHSIEEFWKKDSELTLHAS